MRGIILTLLLAFLPAGAYPLYSQNKIPVELIEEGKAFWDEFLEEGSIRNKNLFYAGYVAYREKLADLSVESFRECINLNSGNEFAKGVSLYYIGKNLFQKGEYTAAIDNFLSVLNNDMGKFNSLKFAAHINIAVSFHRLKNLDKFREHLQKVIAEDLDGRYKKAALELLYAQ